MNKLVIGFLIVAIIIIVGVIAYAKFYSTSPTEKWEFSQGVNLFSTPESLATAKYVGTKTTIEECAAAAKANNSANFTMRVSTGDCWVLQNGSSLEPNMDAADYISGALKGVDGGSIEITGAK